MTYDYECIQIAYRILGIRADKSKAILKKNLKILLDKFLS